MVELISEFVNDVKNDATVAGGVGSDPSSIDNAGNWESSVNENMFVMAGFMSHVMISMPEAVLGKRAFSRAGVTFKIGFYALMFLLGFVHGWLYLYNDSLSWVRAWLVWSVMVLMFSFCVLCINLTKYGGRKSCQGFWFVALSVLNLTSLGVCEGSLARAYSGVWRWMLVTVAFVVVGVLTWFHLVPLVVHNWFSRRLLMVLLCVFPAWLLAKGSGFSLSALFWCALVGVFDVLWFMQDD